MPDNRTLQIHPTAVISAEAELADDVEIGPYVVVEGKVRLGSGCVLRPYAHLVGPLVMGKNNKVFSGAILGEQPQHIKYAGEPTSLEIGDNNVFREHVTIHRGTAHSMTTRIGSNNFFMAGCHVAHDCQIGNHCILANSALLAGHCVLEDNVFLSGNSAVHQFVRIGRLALLSGLSATTKDIPPFIIHQGINVAVGVNVVGMRRAGIPAEQIDAVRRAFHVLFREERVLCDSLAWVEKELGNHAAVRELVTFIRQSARGINLMREHRRQQAA